METDLKEREMGPLIENGQGEHLRTIQPEPLSDREEKNDIVDEDDQISFHGFDDLTHATNDDRMTVGALSGLEAQLAEQQKQE